MGAKFMKPKIALIISPDGIETITLLGKEGNERTAASSLYSSIEQELQDFELIIKRKFNDCNKLKELTTQ